MSLCGDNKKLIRELNKSKNIDSSIENIIPIFQKIIETEPDEKRERKVRNMLYDAKASEYVPSEQLFIPLLYALIICCASVLGTIGSEVQAMGLVVMLLLMAISLTLWILWRMARRKDYRYYILILFLEEQLELYKK